MSRSKRAGGQTATPQTGSTVGPRSFCRRVANIFINANGKWRAGWLLALSVVAFWAVSLILRWGLGAMFSALFGVWGVNGTNIHRAPGWAQAVYAWHGSMITLAVNAATLLLTAALRRMWLGAGAASWLKPRKNAGTLCLSGATGMGMTCSVSAGRQHAHGVADV